MDYNVKPNLPLIGKRLGKLVPGDETRSSQTWTAKRLPATSARGKRPRWTSAARPIPLSRKPFLIDAKSPEGYAALEERGYLAALNTQLTPELEQEGLMRNVIRLVQNARKNAGLEVSDKIVLGLTTSGEVQAALETHRETVQNEVLAESLDFSTVEDALHSEQEEVEGTPVTISLEKVNTVAA